MQLVLEIKRQQDLQLLLPLLERLKIAYKQVPGNTGENIDSKNVVAIQLSDKFAGKLSVEAGKALQDHIKESRIEWE